MASVSKSANGLIRILFTNTNGIRETISLGRVPKKMAERICVHIESLLAHKITNQPLDKATADWVSELDQSLRSKIAKRGLIKEAHVLSLGDFLNDFVLTRKSVQNSTKEVWNQTIRELTAFFGAKKLLSDISVGDARNFKDHLLSKKLAPTTVEKRLGFARQFFNSAVDHGFLDANPFRGVAHSGSGAIKNRQKYIPAAIVKDIINIADRDWKIIIALCRFGGLRCPTEVLSLQWKDINWDKHEMTVLSPKTARYSGKESRVIPIFKELRPFLIEAKENALPGQTHVVGGNFLQKSKGDKKWRNINLRKPFQSLITKAGYSSWPKLFHNLRASCETDQLDSSPLHVVAEWFGHSIEVAKTHYALMKDIHFLKAAGCTLEPQSSLEEFRPYQLQVNAAQNPTQQAPAQPSVNRKENALSLKSVPTYAGVCKTMQNAAKPVKAEEGGFEPPVEFPPHSISSAAQSAALSPLRMAGEESILGEEVGLRQSGQTANPHSQAN